MNARGKLARSLSEDWEVLEFIDHLARLSLEADSRDADMMLYGACVRTDRFPMPNTENNPGSHRLGCLTHGETALGGCHRQKKDAAL